MKSFSGFEKEAGFSITDFDRALVASGGWVEYFPDVGFWY